MEYVVNSDNTVTAIMKSNEPLGDTKPSWTLSSDKLSYTKVFDANIKYSTAVADIYENTIDVSINITRSR